MIFTLSSLLTATLALDGDYKVCPKLETHRTIDAIMLIHSELVEEIGDGTWESAITQVQELLINRENEKLRKNLNLKIKVREWFKTEHDEGSREELCSPDVDAVTLEKNRKAFLNQAHELGREKYPFSGFVHRCDFDKKNPATVVNWVMHIGGNHPKEKTDAQFNYETDDGFGYRYLVRRGSSLLGAWHSKKGNDVMLPKSTASKVFSQEEIDWICEFGFSKDDGAPRTKAQAPPKAQDPPAKRECSACAGETDKNPVMCKTTATKISCKKTKRRGAHWWTLANCKKSCCEKTCLAKL